MINYDQMRILLVLLILLILIILRVLHVLRVASDRRASRRKRPRKKPRGIPGEIVGTASYSSDASHASRAVHRDGKSRSKARACFC